MNTKPPTEILKEEHQAVLKKLEGLENAILNLEKRETASTELKTLAAFFDTEFWPHFDKEESGLFPEFDNFMPRGAGPIAVMLEEHEVLRDTNAAMQQAISAYLNHDNSARVLASIRQDGSHFIETLRAHISKEDSILFSMAEMHLGPVNNERVLRRFMEIDRESIPQI